jgi:hypothetical protein
MYRTSPKTSEQATQINARFLEHLEDTRPQNAGKRRVAAFGFFGGMLLLLGALATLFTHDFALAWPLLPTGAVIALRSWRSLRDIFTREHRFETLLKLGMRGVPVSGYLVQANEALFKPGSEVSLPALVLFSFQPEVDSDPGYMSSLARSVYRLKNTYPQDADGSYVAALTTDERAIPYRRRALPLSFTDGSTIFCADLWIQRSDLRGGLLATNQLTCLADPGENGGIELVPAFLLPAPRPVARLDRRPV